MLTEVAQVVGGEIAQGPPPAAEGVVAVVGNGHAADLVDPSPQLQRLGDERVHGADVGRLVRMLWGLHGLSEISGNATGRHGWDSDDCCTVREHA
ncbi:hypothetical protein GCM10012280_57700 [Wenjunlia tyrosinilytica]|uniref:Uncharacterized protein n=1 Tax=Wenjunlia tyrosinilytica TaxID=1544741 RepID=A0A917ZWK2_9ACTN|nr:hypothetical protein GCM10012280_57700 [Wenjunlia tyrosinilytica]